jgi:hypothetical protein
MPGGRRGGRVPSGGLFRRPFRGSRHRGICHFDDGGEDVFGEEVGCRDVGGISKGEFSSEFAPARLSCRQFPGAAPGRVESTVRRVPTMVPVRWSTWWTRRGWARCLPGSRGCTGVEKPARERGIRGARSAVFRARLSAANPRGGAAEEPAGKAVAHALNHWAALTRYCEDGDLEIDNNAAERG